MLAMNLLSLGGLSLGWRRVHGSVGDLLSLGGSGYMVLWVTFCHRVGEGYMALWVTCYLRVGGGAWLCG